jgi:BioD-like phosphotransacetylase family protein
LQITGDRPGAGKTSTIGALLLEFTAAGQRAAYCKPFSSRAEDDADAAFFSGFASENAPEVPAPQPLPDIPVVGPQLTLEDSVLSTVRETLADLLSQVDVVLVEGPDLANSAGIPIPYALDLASALNCKVVLTFAYAKDLTTSAIIQGCHPFADRLAGVLINGVTSYRTRHAEKHLLKELRAQGVPVFGALKEDRQMLGVTVRDLADFLGGQWVQEPENTDARVDRFLIGGNIMDAGPTYFGRFSNQAVITRGARPDIQMACLTSTPCCIVLTCGEEPVEYIRAEAMQRGVPLILVETKTLETAESLGGLLELATARDGGKLEHFRQLLRADADLDALTKAALG